MWNKQSESRRDFLRRMAAMGLSVPLIATQNGPAGEVASESALGPWQIGCYTRPWAKFDYRVALDAIAEAGFRHAGLMTTNTKSRLVISAATDIEEARKIGEEAAARNLKIPSVYGGGIAVDKSLEAGIADMRRLIENCAAARAATLLMGGTGNADLYDRYYKAVAECCDFAAELGVGITLKPHGGLNATGPQCRKTIEKVGHPNFSLWYDPGNILYYSDAERSPVEDAPTVAGLVTGMCVKDYRHPKNVAVTPGDGQVEFAAVVNRLIAGGFCRGPLVIETLAPGDRPQLLEEARKARRFVEALVAQ